MSTYMNVIVFLGSVVAMGMGGGAWALTAEEADLFDDGFSLQPYLYTGFGDQKIYLGKGIITETGEIHDVYINPSSADGLGVKFRLNLAQVLDIEGGIGYNTVREDRKYKFVHANFSWVNVSASALFRTPSFFTLFDLPVRVMAGTGMDYYYDTEFSFTGWEMSAKYKNEIGSHLILGLEGRDAKKYSTTLGLRYRVIKLDAESLSVGGKYYTDVIGPGGTHLSTIDLTATEVFVGVNWYY
ncbi:MAG: hypothetical protein OEW08_12970 [Gammaproteobacteria bacterium]|nr:hypothetical protein [Gammaproteobacteria bacterium]